MEIIGTVIKVDGNCATVSVKRASACGENCAHCKGACEETKMTAKAENTAEAAVGDIVKIESHSGAVVRAAVVLYLVPVVVTILVAAALYGMGVRDLFVMLFSVLAFFASFFIIKCFDKKIAPKSYITKVIKKA